MINPIDFAWNRSIGWRRPGVKIFFVGFNKCGTSALHDFLRRQGVRSAHWRSGGANLALEIEKRLESPGALRDWLGRWTAYSDLMYSSDERIVDANRHFRAFHALFPDAYFVLNDRDPERWVQSRLHHRQGQFARRSARLLGCTPDALPGIWLEERERHHRAVLDHFAGLPRFLHFRIDRDPVARLIDFLSLDFRLKSRQWQPSNVTRKV